MIIVFEGLDKSGKTTLKNVINVSTGYEHVVIDRGPWSNMFFDKVIRSNKKLYKRHKRDARKFQKAVDLIVFCYCDKKSTVLRHKENQEELPSYFENNYKGLVKQYIKMIIGTAACDILIVKTDIYSPKATSIMIQNYIEKIKQEKIKRNRW